MDVGTPAYSAPELLRAEPGTVYGKAVDVYSYAICAWELLTNAVPYDGEYKTVFALRAAILQGARPSLKGPFAMNVPNFVGLVQMCWSDNPLLRPSFDNILEAIHFVLHSLPDGSAE